MRRDLTLPRACLHTTLVALLVSCAGSSPPPPVEEPVSREEPAAEAPEAAPAPLEEDPPGEGAACFSPEECAEGEHCRGPVGCSTDFACGAERECGEATVSYCGCDAVTFYAPENCPGRPYQNVGPCGDLGELVEDAPEAVEGSRLCTSEGDCRRGFVCAGAEGCATFWTCVRRRRMRPRCTRRTATFCSCEGETFEASATCPGRPIVHDGPCAGDEPPEAIAVAPVEAPRVQAPRVQTPQVQTPRVQTARVAPRPEPPPISPRQELTAPPAEVTCRSNADCPRGQTCQGEEGCGGQWQCAPPRARCISDTQRFCGCDGQTFRASMTCPGRPHRHRGSCPR